MNIDVYNSMALKEIISRWHAAAEAFHQNQHRNALNGFKEMKDVHPSAKILFNIAYIHYYLGELHKSYEVLNDCIGADGHLAVGYFLRGIILYKLERYTESYEDFQQTFLAMRQCSVIDYNQLGLPMQLFTCEVLSNAAVLSMLLSDRSNAQLCLKQAEFIHKELEIRHDCLFMKLDNLLQMNTHSFQIRELPNDCIFQPPKALVANLPKRDYLGKAKVVSSVFNEESDRNITLATSIQKEGTSHQRTKVRTPPPSRPPPRPLSKITFSKSEQCLSSISHNHQMKKKGNRSPFKMLAKSAFSKSEHNISRMFKHKNINKHGVAAPPRPPPTWMNKVNRTGRLHQNTNRNSTSCLNCSERSHVHVYECIENCNSGIRLYEPLEEPSRISGGNHYNSIMISNDVELDWDRFKNNKDGVSFRNESSSAGVYVNTSDSHLSGSPMELDIALSDTYTNTPHNASSHPTTKSIATTSSSLKEVKKLDDDGSVSNLISRFEMQTLTTE